MFSIIVDEKQRRQQHFCTLKAYTHNRKTFQSTSYLEANILKLEFFAFPISHAICTTNIIILDAIIVINDFL